MADFMQRTGDTGLEVSIDFPDAKTREDFETSFRGWLKEYQQRTNIQRSLRAAGGTPAGDEEVSGYLYTNTERGVYWNLM